MGDPLQEEGEVADISEADRDAVEPREDFWSMSGEYLSPPCHAQRRIVCTEQSHHSQILQNISTS